MRRVHENTRGAQKKDRNIPLPDCAYLYFKVIPPNMNYYQENVADGILQTQEQNYSRNR